MMKIPNNLLLIAALGCGLLAPAGALVAAEQAPTLEQRLERLERILRNQSLTDIILQLQQLQQEVRQLRGEVELQSHTLDALNKRQRDLYLDIDQRLSNLRTAPTAAPDMIESGAAPVMPEPEAAPVSATRSSRYRPWMKNRS